MIVCVENPKESTITTKPLELLSDYNKVAGYKIKIQNSIDFLYTGNEPVKLEIRNTVPFILATKNK